MKKYFQYWRRADLDKVAGLHPRCAVLARPTFLSRYSTFMDDANTKYLLDDKYKIFDG
jgi:hypothetical protein